MSLVLEVSDHGSAPWAERFGTVPTRTGSTCSSTVPTKNRLNLYSARSTHQQIEIVCVINTGIIRPLMIALQVSHFLQFPWTMSRSLVKINVNQFSPVTDLIPFSFSSPVVFVGSLSCSLLDAPVMQCSCPTGIRHFQNKLNLFWFGGGYQR